MTLTVQTLQQSWCTFIPHCRCCSHQISRCPDERTARLQTAPSVVWSLPPTWSTGPSRSAPETWCWPAAACTDVRSTAATSGRAHSSSLKGLKRRRRESRYSLLNSSTHLPLILWCRRYVNNQTLRKKKLMAKQMFYFQEVCDMAWIWILLTWLLVIHLLSTLIRQPSVFDVELFKR